MSSVHQKPIKIRIDKNPALKNPKEMIKCPVMRGYPVKKGNTTKFTLNKYIVSLPKL